MRVSLLERLLSIGDGPWLVPDERRRVRFLNGAFGLASLAGAAFAALALPLMETRQSDGGPFVGLALGALTLWLQHRRHYRTARHVAYLGTAAFIVAAGLLWMPEGLGLRVYLLVIAMAAFLMPRQRFDQELHFVLCIAGYAWLEWLAAPHLYTLAHVVGAGAVLYVVGRVFRREHEAAIAVLTERDAATTAQNRQLSDLNAVLDTSLRTTEAQAERLDVLNATKDRAVSVLSHDLYSPIASLDAVLAGYDDGLLTSDDLAALLPETRRAVATTREQLEDVLGWVRLLLGEGDGAATTPIGPLAERVRDHLSARAAAKGVALTVSAPPDLVVAAEPAAVLLVLRNLMGNALKFTPEGGRVAVTAAADGDVGRLLVRDTGVGMPPERVDRANRGDRSGQTTPGTAGEKGSGLGLWLCRDVVARMGGTLHVESAEGAGTTVAVTLPLAPPVAVDLGFSPAQVSHPTHVVNR